MAFKSNSAKWFNEESAVLKRTVRNMIGVTVNRGQMLAPFAKGDLKSSGRVTGQGEKSAATFGGSDVGVPYAKRRHFENKKNPQTLLYLKKAGDSVIKEGFKKYYNLSK